jgi:hypothetical protein
MNDVLPSKATSKPTGLQKRPICRTEANKKLQKDIYYFIAVIILLSL